MANSTRILRDVKSAIREPYAWPGGYPLYVLMNDGEALSIEAAKENWRSICWSTLHKSRDGWDAAGVDINWEDTNLVCAHTGKPIESAYGDQD
jgi:hypothetical protein